jgi:predicted glycosyltransferase
MPPTRNTLEADTRAPRRVLAYCHDSVGIGHLRRTLAICEHLGAVFPRTSFLLATGTPYFPMFHPSACVDYIKLPALAKRGDGTYRPKFLDISMERIVRSREALLQLVADRFEPDMLLVDKAPLGVCRELVPTLRWLRLARPGVRVVFGMRDIEDTPRATMRQWGANGTSALIEKCYDDVWVYGTKDVFDVGVKYRLSPRIRRKLRYMGYIQRPSCSHALPASGGRELLVTVGGGTDGEQVIDVYLADAARRAAAVGVRSTIVGGPDLPDDARRRLRAAASQVDGVEWVDYTECLSCHIRRAELVVCMGGYNTLCEVVAQGKPALVIPRTRPRMEQTMRAVLWQKRGAVRSLNHVALTPRTLADEVLDMLVRPLTPTDPALDFRGLDRIADRCRALWLKESPHAVAVRM